MGASDSPPGGGVGLRGPTDPRAALGGRRGSRRDRPAPGRCRSARRCVTTCGSTTAVGVVGPPPGVRVAMLAAATRSRCPENSQWGQDRVRPRGFGTRLRQVGQVEEVPRSSTSRTVMPARVALSVRTCTSRPICHCRSRRLCRRPAGRSSTPRGSPTCSTPTRWRTAQETTVAAAWCWAWRIRRAAFGGGDAHPKPVKGERAVIPAHRHQPPPPAREPGRPVTVAAALRRREPRIRKPAQHRPRTDRVQFSERARPGRRQLPTQLLIAHQRHVVAAAPPRVDLQHARPHVTGRAQQPEAPSPLAGCHA
ncbi:hypothetical protein GA0070624_6171 [Micromonospora rhizosphaerae]|uniref:Uncharacterized protein n=1 Tax=Micromonospora rhizosphaerae TaxID=568872 RepID=A0A1C6T924_9ACTN|nr:hypothetical protein GA0070624_6171 [Micromonospora rhizosphaerae]